MTEMQEKSLVKLLNSRGDCAGAGVLALGNRVITVAHAVNLALGRDRDAQDDPEESFSVELTAENVKTQADVMLWSPPAFGTGTGDFALLRLRQEPKRRAPLTRLDVSTKFLGASTVWIHGFPYAEGYPTGSVVKGEHRSISRDFVEFAVDDPGEITIEEGFSGGGVWNENRDALLGLLISFDPRRRRGMYLRCAQISRLVGLHLAAEDYSDPGMEPQFEILRWFRIEASQALLEDLEALEEDGLMPNQCLSVRVKLGRIATIFSDLGADVAVSVTPTFQKVEKFQLTYTKWNECATKHERRSALRKLRGERANLAKDLKLLASAFSHVEAAERIEAIVSALEELVEEHPDVFPRLQSSVRGLRGDVAA